MYVVNMHLLGATWGQMPLPSPASPLTSHCGWRMECADVFRLCYMLIPKIPSKLHELNVKEEWYPKENERAFVRRGMDGLECVNHLLSVLP